MQLIIVHGRKLRFHHQLQLVLFRSWYMHQHPVLVSRLHDHMLSYHLLFLHQLRSGNMVSHHVLHGIRTAAAVLLILAAAVLLLY